MFSIKHELGKVLSRSLQKTLGDAFDAGRFLSFELPKEEKFGDLSTPAAFRIAKELKKSPRALAEEVLKNLNAAVHADPQLKQRIADIRVEGPGYINFFYTPRQVAEVLTAIGEEGVDFGKPKELKPRKILLEFVSANPTGPLTVAHGRQAALGDSLARILKFCGHRVSTEYYNNDEGVQIETLGKSLELRAEEIQKNKKIEMPEDFYRGEYLIEIARKYLERHGAATAADFASMSILSGIQKDLSDFGVSFDHIYSQKELGRSGKVEKTLAELKKKGVVYDEEGAVWFRSMDFGDDKNRVLVKSDKSYTYLTPDIAYHHEKFSRGFEELIDIWGPDHHGYIARLKASQQALGHDPESIKILIAQLVTLYEQGKQVRMSTRAGEFVTLREILDEVGKDAGRFFFVMRKFDAHLDFDLALAKTQTPENPVFYIQYAHARIENIKKKFPRPGDHGGSSQYRLSEPAEIKLMRLLSQYPEVILAAERTLEPYRLVPYLMDLAGSFHKFYTDHRVVTEDAELTAVRLMLCESVQVVIRSGLSLLGVSAPLKM